MPHVANGHLNVANSFVSKHLKAWMFGAKQYQNNYILFYDMKKALKVMAQGVKFVKIFLGTFLTLQMLFYLTQKCDE